MIVRECIYYINIRQAYLSSPYYAERISSRTILLQCVPESYLNERRLRKLYGDSVKRVTIPRTTKALANMVKEREQTAMRLEKAEVELIRKANAARVKQAKKTAKKEAKEARRASKTMATSETHELKQDDAAQSQLPHSDSVLSQQDLVAVGTNSISDDSQMEARGGCVVVELPGAATMEADEKDAEADEAVHVVRTDTSDTKRDDEEDEYTHPYGLDPKLADVRGSVAAQYIPVQQRPYHRPLGNFLRRVDTIRWTRNRLRELNVQIYKMRKQVRRGEGATLPAAFIEFHTGRCRCRRASWACGPTRSSGSRCACLGGSASPGASSCCRSLPSPSYSGPYHRPPSGSYRRSTSWPRTSSSYRGC